MITPRHEQSVETSDVRMVQDQCRAVAHLAHAIAEVYEARALFVADGKLLVERIGESSASALEWLGDTLNGLDAVEDDDAWIDPIIEAAQARWPASETRASAGDIILPPLPDYFQSGNAIAVERATIPVAVLTEYARDAIQVDRDRRASVSPPASIVFGIDLGEDGIRLVRDAALEQAAAICGAAAQKNESRTGKNGDEADDALRTVAWQLSVCARAIRALKTAPSAVQPEPDIPRTLLARIVDEVFDSACEDTSAIEDIYRVIVREYGVPASPPESADAAMPDVSNEAALTGVGRLLGALQIAEAALDQIGDAGMMGDDVASCERTAAEALPVVRDALGWHSAAIPPFHPPQISGNAGDLDTAPADTYLAHEQTRHALEETQALLVAMLHEQRLRPEIEAQIRLNRQALDAQALSRQPPEDARMDQLVEWLRARQDWAQVILDSNAVRELVKRLEAA